MYFGEESTDMKCPIRIPDMNMILLGRNNLMIFLEVFSALSCPHIVEMTNEAVFTAWLNDSGRIGSTGILF